MKHDNLYPHEWMAVMALLLFLAVLIQFAWNAPETRWPDKEGKPVSIPFEQVVVSITGAVTKEGRYHFPAGITVGEALEKIELLPEASVEKLDLKKPLKRGQRIKIPQKKLAKQDSKKTGRIARNKKH